MLTQEKLAQVERKLLDACKKAEKQERNIKPSNWGLANVWTSDFYRFNKQSKCCCPNAALLVCNEVKSIGDPLSSAAKYLGVSPYFVRGFIGGFDDPDDHCYAKEGEQGFNLGVKFRKRFAK